tara:strand:- start:26267 stop:26629 length:363 start_codon:yes stop_codon:yes gene_type:complete
VAINVIDVYSSVVPIWIRKAANAINQLARFSNGERSAVAVTTTYTLEENDTFLAVDAGAITITIPAVTDVRRVTIKDTGGNAGTSTITLSGTIDGVAGPTITTNYGVVNLISNGTAWFTY